MTERQDHAASESFAGLLARILTELLHVLQGGAQLARAEVAQGLRGIQRGAGLIVVAALTGLVALNTAAGAAVSAVVWLGVSPAWAGLAVAVILLLLAYAALRFGLVMLSPWNLLPRRSLSRLRDDIETLISKVIPDDRDESPFETEPKPGPDRGAA